MKIFDAVIIVLLDQLLVNAANNKFLDLWDYQCAVNSDITHRFSASSVPSDDKSLLVPYEGSIWTYEQWNGIALPYGLRPNEPFYGIFLLLSRSLSKGILDAMRKHTLSEEDTIMKLRCLNRSYRDYVDLQIGLMLFRMYHRNMFWHPSRPSTRLQLFLYLLSGSRWAKAFDTKIRNTHMELLGKHDMALVDDALNLSFEHPRILSFLGSRSFWCGYFRYVFPTVALFVFWCISMVEHYALKEPFSFDWPYCLMILCSLYIIFYCPHEPSFVWPGNQLPYRYRFLPRRLSEQFQ
jgi:hypothetical protein